MAITLSGGMVIGAMTFSPPPANDPYFSYTTLLLPGNGTNNAQNNTFLDSSTNNTTITRNGNTTQGTANPFGSGYAWSTYFNGNGNYLEAPSSSAFDFGTGDFTIECWVNLAWFSSSGTSSKLSTLVFGAGSNADGGGSTRWDFDVTYQGYLLFQNASEGGANSFGVQATNNALSLNTWTHVAVTRVGTDINLFVNGVKCTVSGTIGASQSVTRSSVTRIGRLFTSATYDFQTQGYISNLRILKGTALYTATFTPPTGPLTPITNTVLLTCQNASLNDNSAYNFAMTNPGNATENRYGPFSNYAVTPQSYSVAFDGSGDYLSVASNAAFNFGSGSFTMEAWICPSRYSSSYSGYYTSQIIAKDTIGGRELGFSITGTASSFTSFSCTLFTDNSTPVAVSASYNFNLNTWYHVAVSRDVNTIRLFVNGVIVATNSSFTATAQTTSTALTIGSELYSGYEYYFSGCISNCRIVKGQALYTANFTPSTSPLTTTSQGATAANVSLLTCQSTTIIDNSTNAFAITANGDAKPRQINPFGYDTASSMNAWSTTLFGGSAYFDGSGDYMTASYSTSLYDWWTTDYTLEAWVYPTTLTGWGYADGATPKANLIGNNAYNGTGNNWSFGPYSDGTVKLTYYSGSSQSATSTAKVIAGQWNHIAFTKTSSGIVIYVNGTASSATAISGSPGSSAATPLTIGAGNSAYINGYVSGIRIVKGTAVYTGPFVPPTAPVTAIANTNFLLSATNGAIYDATMTADAETAGDAKISTAQSKFGGSSMYFDGTGDYLSMAANPGFDFGTGDFTVEFWMNASASGTYTAVVGTQSISGNTTAGMWRVSIRLNSVNGIYFNYSTGSAFTDITFTTTNYNDNTWHYVAVSKSGSTLRAFVDGTQVGSNQTVTQSLSSGQKLFVGYQAQDSVYYTGYISDLRITKGVARYTTAFTPPTAALPTS